MGNGLREFVFGLSYGVETGDTIVEDASLMLYYMVRNKEVFVADNMNWNSGVHWDISFTRSVNDWEVGILQSFLGLLYSFKVTRVEEDWMCWTHTSMVFFRFKSYYRALTTGFPGKAFGRLRFLLISVLHIQQLGTNSYHGESLGQNMCLVDWCCMCKQWGDH